MTLYAKFLQDVINNGDDESPFSNTMIKLSLVHIDKLYKAYKQGYHLYAMRDWTELPDECIDNAVNHLHNGLPLDDYLCNVACRFTRSYLNLYNNIRTPDTDKLLTETVCNGRVFIRNLEMLLEYGLNPLEFKYIMEYGEKVGKMLIAYYLKTGIHADMELLKSYYSELSNKMLYTSSIMEKWYCCIIRLMTGIAVEIPSTNTDIVSTKYSILETLYDYDKLELYESISPYLDSIRMADIILECLRKGDDILYLLLTSQHDDINIETIKELLLQYEDSGNTSMLLYEY